MHDLRHLLFFPSRTYCFRWDEYPAHPHTTAACPPSHVNEFETYACNPRLTSTCLLIVQDSRLLWSGPSSGRQLLFSRNTQPTRARNGQVPAHDLLASLSGLSLSPYVLHPVPHDFNVQVCLIKTPWLVIHPSGVSGCFVQDTLPSTQYHNDTEVTNVKVREASHVRASFHKTIRFQFHTCHTTPLKSDAHVRNLSLIEHGLITARFASIYRIADGL